MFDNLKEDLQRYLEFLPDNSNIFRKIQNVFLSQGFWAILVFRFGVWLCKSKMSYLIFIVPYLIFKKLIEITTGINIGTNAKIGKRMYINHFGGIHINSKCVIGKYAFINQDVTIGDAGYTKNFGAPILGDNVYIGAGAKIIGDVVLGDNVIVGANAVVVKSASDNVTLVGVPAKTISRSEK